MDAIILAAGDSRRFLRDSGTHKLSIRINRIPLICYPITSLSLANASSIVIIVSQITKSLVREAIVQCPYSSEIEWIKVNNETWRDNGYTLLLGLEDIVSHKSLFLVSMSDHIYPPIIPLAIKNISQPCIGADSNPKFINIGEATKIRILDDNNIVIGKKVRNYDYVDVGVHQLSTRLDFSKCRRKFLLKMTELLYCIFNKNFKIIDLKGTPWIDIDILEDYINAVEGQARRVIDMVMESWRTMGITTG